MQSMQGYHSLMELVQLYLLVIMSMLPVDIPMEKNKRKLVHHGRRSLDKSCLTITTVDSELLPSYLTPSKGSCHDKCKYGSKRSLRIPKLVVDSSARRNGQAKRPRQINPEPWRIVGASCSTYQQSKRWCSELIDPKRYQNLGRRIDGALKSREKLGKKARALPEVSRTVKSSANGSLKKQKTVAEVKCKKRVEEHVEEKILHVVEQKAESEGNEAICGTTSAGSSCSSKGTFEEEVINETSDPDNSPTKLKFEKGKIIDILQVGKLNWSLRKTEPESRVNGPRKSIVIKLRHQIVENKQGSHKRSYNSLIEDTTHSLVWINKSKVKALVNAFECVISMSNSQPWK